MIYPNDANGDALRRMEAEGDDLSRPRNIDFTVVFSNKNSAEEFRELYPEVEISLRNIFTAEQVQMLETGSLDIGFLRLPLPLCAPSFGIWSREYPSPFLVLA
jgi:DNA-binding transcriptional LysR family regulator